MQAPELSGPEEGRFRPVSLRLAHISELLCVTKYLTLYLATPIIPHHGRHRSTAHARPELRPHPH